MDIDFEKIWPLVEPVVKEAYLLALRDKPPQLEEFTPTLVKTITTSLNKFLERRIKEYIKNSEYR